MDTHTEPQLANERRHHPLLRAIYPQARTHIDHLFHNRHDWAGTPIDILALRVIHETYPHLHSTDIRILVNAIEQMHLALAEQETASNAAHAGYFANALRPLSAHSGR
ncbi:MAG: hypothetical protein B7Y41_14855 [Hydrogenophilales bacterium 28-61-23]|nr:MAG: hypothetical protein B7Y41_14855 [Hydrogenophilales bacterium 28-61-23]